MPLKPPGSPVMLRRTQEALYALGWVPAAAASPWDWQLEAMQGNFKGLARLRECLPSWELPEEESPRWELSVGVRMQVTWPSGHSAWGAEMGLDSRSGAGALRLAREGKRLLEARLAALALGWRP